ncbi:MAG: tetratricopeptide repeat protein [Candidatus Latescibacteria bacterium]|nr:tetratricopeptide repeat protein [Candidatus Latescibacterota bacterium]
MEEWIGNRDPWPSSLGGFLCFLRVQGLGADPPKGYQAAGAFADINNGTSFPVFRKQEPPVRLTQLLLIGAGVLVGAAPSAAVTVSGVVSDAEGSPVAGVVVIFADQDNTVQIFADSTTAQGTYRIDLNSATAVGPGTPRQQPTAFHLFPNYPNPFNPSTLIGYQLGQAAHVRLRIYNLLGQSVRTLVDQVQAAGLETVEWDGRLNNGAGAAAGIYVVRMEAQGLVLSRKMVLLDGAGAAAAPGRPAARPVVLQGLYTVRIEGRHIEPLWQEGVRVSADTTLDFQISRLAEAAIAVAPGGDIGQALERALSGDIVLLAQGIYSDQRVDLKAGVVLRGRVGTVLEGVHLRADHIDGVAIENLTLRRGAVVIDQADVALRNCRIENSQSAHAIHVQGPQGRALVEGCAMVGSRGVGLWAQEGAQVQLSDNTLAANSFQQVGGAVVLTGAGTYGVLQGNDVRDNGGPGLIIAQGAGGEIAANTFTHNAQTTDGPQLDIRGPGTDPVLRDNTVIGRSIWVQEGAGGLLEGNTIDATTTGTALVLSGGQTYPIVQNNTVQGSIRIEEQAGGLVVGNTIGGREIGVEISGAGTHPTIRDNDLTGAGAGTVGIKVGEASAAVIVANTIAGYGTGIQLIGAQGGAGEISDNTLRDNIRDRRQVSAQIVWMDRFSRAQEDLKAGRFDRAIETFKLAAAEAPYPAFRVQARYYMGVSLMRKGRFDEAVPVLEGVVDLDPQHQKARWNLRIACRQLGLDPQQLAAPYRLDLAPGMDPLHESVRFTDIGPETGMAVVNMGRGTAWRDFDGDGWLDLFTVEDGGVHALFRNMGDGSFVDGAATAGLADPRGGWSATWLDYDNDGAADIFVTRDGFQGPGPNSLYRNLGDGTFVDVARQAGLVKLADSFVSAGGDYDNDGWVDVYVGNGIIQKGHPNSLYRNQGDGTFVEVAAQAGVDNGRGATIGVVWGDYDNDGWLDLYAVNNGTSSALYRNQGDGTFTDVTKEAGVPGPLFGFVAFFLDYNGDGWLDLFVSSSALTIDEVIDSAVTGKPSLFSGNRAYLYRNNGDGTFADMAREAGVGLTLGTMAATYGDIDNDGYPDLYLANGGPAMDRFEPDRLYLNNRNGTYADVSEAAGLEVIGKGHGTTMADFDNDGDLDIYSPQGGVGGNDGNAQPNRFYRNEGNDHHWLIVRLVGGAGASPSEQAVSNRDGIGAKVTVEVGGARRYSEVSGGSGFGVTNSLPLEFGLGAARQVEAVEVRWPSGHIDRLQDVAVDQVLTIVEGMTAIGAAKRSR